MKLLLRMFIDKTIKHCHCLNDRETNNFLKTFKSCNKPLHEINHTKRSYLWYLQSLS